MQAYGLHGKLQAVQGKGDALSFILLQASQMLSKVQGCRLYIISRDTQDADCVWVTEVWDSREDHDNSLKAEGIRELIMQAMPLLAGQPEKGMELHVLGGAGLG